MENFILEALYLHGPNVVRLQLDTGRKRWNIRGCYITPDDSLTIEDIITAIRRRSHGSELLVSDDLNTDLVEPEGTTRAEEITADLTVAGLE